MRYTHTGHLHAVSPVVVTWAGLDLCVATPALYDLVAASRVLLNEQSLWGLQRQQELIRRPSHTRARVTPLLTTQPLACDGLCVHAVPTALGALHALLGCSTASECDVFQQPVLLAGLQRIALSLRWQPFRAFGVSVPLWEGPCSMILSRWH